MSDQSTKRETKKTPSKSDGSQSVLPSTSKQILPQEVRVLGRTFRVEVVDMAEDDVLGDTIGLYRRIRISRDLTRRQQWTTLVHEWAHAVLYVNGVASVIPDEVEEIIVQSFEHAVEELLEQVGEELLQHLSLPED
jgi:hypothetical protein